MTIIDFIAKYNTRFADNATRDISEADLREFVSDITTLTDIPIDLSGFFWPLSGAAALTDDLDIDGGGFDLLFDSLLSFTVNTTDGTDTGILSVEPDVVSLTSYDAGTNSSIITSTPISADIAVSDGTSSLLASFLSSLFDFSVTDGVDTSSLTLGPDSLDLVVDGDVFIDYTDSFTIDVPNSPSGDVFNIESVSGDAHQGLFFTGAGGFGISIPSFGYRNVVSGAANLFQPANGVQMYSTDGAGVTNTFNIQGIEGATGARFIDGRATKRGIEYSADGYVTQDRSLTDKGYVDNQIASALGGGGGSLTLQTYTVATLPDEATNQDGLIVVTDESGGRTPAFSDGTNWRRLYDMNIVS